MFQQALLILALDKIYEYGRGLIPHNGPIAVSHAHAVWSWEVAHGLFVEPAWQQFWLTKDHIIGHVRITPDQVTTVLNTMYLYIHFLGTIAFLIWLFLCRREIFPFVRNVFFLTTLAALAIYILYPLAPPRLTPDLLYYHHQYRFIDTIEKVLDPRLQTSTIGYNPYAAMPSLHFGWSLIVGGTLAYTLRQWPLRILACLYPFLMLATIVISGNHYFADALASLAIVILATGVIGAATYGWRHLRSAPPTVAIS